jgi:hypothetical protein
MNKTTLQALKESIKHWERLCLGHDEPLGTKGCALCKKFWDFHSCDGCPVQARTGLPYCNGTPYESAWRAKELRDKRFKKELEFLKSLLPRKRKKK